jgi:hypothetical protein
MSPTTSTPSAHIPLVETLHATWIERPALVMLYPMETTNSRQYRQIFWAHPPLNHSSPLCPPPYPPLASDRRLQSSFISRQQQTFIKASVSCSALYPSNASYLESPSLIKRTYVSIARNITSTLRLKILFASRCGQRTRYVGGGIYFCIENMSRFYKTATCATFEIKK